MRGDRGYLTVIPKEALQAMRAGFELLNLICVNEYVTLPYYF